MEPVTANCPQCETRLAVPPNRSRVICPRCGATYEARGFGTHARFEGKSWSDGSEPKDVIRTKLAELDELIDGVQAEIEALKSRELSAPLQLGCSFFSIFIVVMIVLAASMLLGRSYFGSWIFYLCLAVVVLFGAGRLRRKLKDRAPAAQTRRERLDLEEDLADLVRERDRVQRLKISILSQDEPNRF